MRTAFVLTFVVALAASLLPACSVHESACSPGDYMYCACPSGPRGYATCASDGSGYGACDCSGVLPPGVLTDAGFDADDAADGAVDAAPTGAGFGEPCADPGDCAEGLECYPFNAKGPRCSKKCSSGADCPVPPGLGCSNMGECKVP